MTAAIARWFTVPPAPSGTVDPRGARRAAANAEKALAEEQHRSHETTQTTTSLRKLREQNHWADLIYDSMEPK